MKDIVFDICERMLRNSPERSYKRLNPALWSTLANCIGADLPFQRDTFKEIYHNLRGGRWFGDGAGSSVGEHYYTMACAVNHASAQQSFEHFAERPAVLWEENVGSPSRLHVGSQFTWKGYYVTVTSMRTDSLVACTYKDYPSRVNGLKPGATIGYDPEYIITAAEKDGAAATLLRVVKVKKTEGDREIARRFTIKYTDIADFRRTESARMKVVLAKIAQCGKLPGDVAAIRKEIDEAQFRHFQLEKIRKAFRDRQRLMSDAESIDLWRSGAVGQFLETEAILLRVRGDRVECSTGTSVSKVAACRVLPVLLANRNKRANLDMPLEGYTVKTTAPGGVVVGCTLIPWREIEIIAPQLQISE